MNIIVCGGRHFAQVALLWRTLDGLDTPAGIIRRVADGASDDVTGPYVGADYWGHQWALARGKATSRYHADWKAHGRSAGPRRNEFMLKEVRPEIVVAFQGGSGTASMIGIAHRAGVRVIEVA